MGNQRKNWGLFFFLAGFWGTSYIAIKFAIHEWPPIYSAFLRVLFSLIILTFIALWKKAPLKLSSKDRFVVWIAGSFSQGIPFAFLYWGETSISPGLAGILNGTVPLWTFLLGLALRDPFEAFTWKRLIGILIGFSGLAAIFAPLIGGGEAMRHQVAGAIALLIMAASYAISNVMTKSLLSVKKIDFWANLWHQTFAGVVTLLILTALFDPRWPTLQEAISLKPLLSTLYLAAVSSTLGWIIYFTLIRDWGSVRASTVTYVVPLTAMFWDYVFFKTIPSLGELWGISLILAGVILIQLPLGKLKLKRVATVK